MNILTSINEHVCTPLLLLGSDYQSNLTIPITNAELVLACKPHDLYVINRGFKLNLAKPTKNLKDQ